MVSLATPGSQLLPCRRWPGLLSFPAFPAKLKQLAAPRLGRAHSTTLVAGVWEAPAQHAQRGATNAH
eukprot:11432843-Alexandrium_andersonii.AAC.1